MSSGAAHVTGCTLCQAHICEHVYAEVEELRAEVNSANITMRREQSLRSDVEEERDENEREYNEVIADARYEAYRLSAERDALRHRAATSEALSNAHLARALSAEKQNKTLRMLLDATQRHRDLAVSALAATEAQKDEIELSLRNLLGESEPKQGETK